MSCLLAAGMLGLRRRPGQAPRAVGSAAAGPAPIQDGQVREAVDPEVAGHAARPARGGRPARWPEVLASSLGPLSGPADRRGGPTQGRAYGLMLAYVMPGVQAQARLPGGGRVWLVAAVSPGAPPSRRLIARGLVPLQTRSDVHLMLWHRGNSGNWAATARAPGYAQGQVGRILWGLLSNYPAGGQAEAGRRPATRLGPRMFLLPPVSAG
jgi:hypothetical protein